MRTLDARDLQIELLARRAQVRDFPARLNSTVVAAASLRAPGRAPLQSGQAARALRPVA
jgi:hypothetical protein